MPLKNYDKTIAVLGCLNGKDQFTDLSLMVFLIIWNNSTLKMIFSNTVGVVKVPVSAEHNSERN